MTVDLRDPSATQISVDAPLFVTLENGTASIPFEGTSSDNSELTWFFSNGYTAVGNNLQLDFTEAGEYSYTVVSSGDCGGSCSGVFQIGLQTGINDQNNSNDIQVIDHENAVELRFGIVAGGKGTVRIYDMSGKMVFTRGVTMSAGQTITIDTANLSSGIYNIHVITADEQSFVSRVYKR